MLSRHSRRRGSFAVEVLVAALVGAAITVPLLGLLFQERDTEQRSRFQYLALLAARDEMYEARLAVAAGADPDSLNHDWKKLEGDPFGAMAGLAPALGLPVTYHPEQARVSTRLQLEPDDGSLIRLARLEARWLDEEEPATGGGTPRPTSLQIVFGVLKPR